MSELLGRNKEEMAHMLGSNLGNIITTIQDTKRFFERCGIRRYVVTEYSWNTVVFEVPRRKIIKMSEHRLKLPMGVLIYVVPLPWWKVWVRKPTYVNRMSEAWEGGPRCDYCYSADVELFDEFPDNFICNKCNLVGGGRGYMEGD